MLNYCSFQKEKYHTHLAVLYLDAVLKLRDNQNSKKEDLDKARYESSESQLFLWRYSERYDNSTDMTDTVMSYIDPSIMSPSDPEFSVLNRLLSILMTNAVLYRNSSW